MWSWAVETGYGYVTENVVRKVAKPRRINKPARNPLTKQQIMDLFAAVEEGEHPLRDRAILYVLLDTGIRASELCNLRLEDINGTALRVLGKGDKEREVPLSRRSWEAVSTYLRTRYRVNDSDALFVSKHHRSLTRSGLFNMLDRLGGRTGHKVHPHLFRHTFAINYLRGDAAGNRGDPWTLKRILGHATMTMVEEYLAIARADIIEAHRYASPVTKMEL